MSEYLRQHFPNLKPFNYERHHDDYFINKEWILVNGISEKKSVYTFREDNILEISRKVSEITTSWNLSINNIFTIETEDGLITVKAFFKDDDILVLDHQDKDEFAVFINITNYSEDISSIDDIQDYLKSKYQKKASKLIHGHEFFYIEKSKEFGPYRVEILSEKVKKNKISAYCFVRDINEDDYSKRLRIIDLINEL
ncbi:MAG: hypothetical protein HRU26_03430 [Psychroserpens sp.]|nr:hypothetical protein [Psychroserpens sp.]